MYVLAPHSSALAWKLPWMEEPGRLQSMGSLRVGHDPVTSLSLFTFPALEKEMTTHSSVLAWRIPGTAEPGGLQSVGPHRVRHDWCDLAAAAAVACGNFIFKSQRHSIVNLSEVKHSFPCLLPHPPLPGYHAEPPVKSITCMSSLSSTFIIPHCNHVENKIQV